MEVNLHVHKAQHVWAEAQTAAAPAICMGALLSCGCLLMLPPHQEERYCQLLCFM